MRGRHLFKGVAYFIFQYFSLKIAFVFVSNRQKKLSNEITTYFSIYTQVCYDHVLSLELSIKTILKHYIQRSSLRSADAFPVVASLPPKNSVCEPERQNDFRDVKPF